MRRLYRPIGTYLLAISCVALFGYLLIIMRLGDVPAYEDPVKPDLELMELIRKIREYSYVNNSIINIIDARLKSDLNIDRYQHMSSFGKDSRYDNSSNILINFIRQWQKVRDNMTRNIESINNIYRYVNNEHNASLGTQLNINDGIPHLEEHTNSSDGDDHKVPINPEPKRDFGNMVADSVQSNHEREADTDKAQSPNRHIHGEEIPLSKQTDTGETETRVKDTDIQEQVNTEIQSFDITDNDDHIYLVENTYYEKPGKARSTYKWRDQYKEVMNETYEYRKRVYTTFYKADLNDNTTYCSGIITGDVYAIQHAIRFMNETPKSMVSPVKYARIKHCEKFKRARGYIDHPLTYTERDFPLAFALIVYKSIEQVERLLRAIYRPQNYYCIHVDSKSKPAFKAALKSISGCFQNVFLSEKSINVTWGGFSLLEAELECIRTLWDYEKWVYYINLTGQEFPLKTNLEIVEILKAMHGANIVDGTWVRARQKYFYRWTQAGDRPPHQIRPIKGSVHVAINRHMADFALHDRRAHDFLQWLTKTQIPDETFFASLNHNPHLGIIGSFLGEPEEYPLKPSFMRYKNWAVGHGVWARSCAGKYVRDICILGVGDVSRAIVDVGLFVNKFHIDFEYLALDCVEEWLYQRTWDQYMNNAHVDVTFYEHLDQVKYQLKETGDLP